MIKNEKNTFKIFLILGVIILVSILTYGVAQIWVFLSVSRTNSEMFLEVKDTPDIYTPKLTWLPDEPVERPMEDFTRDILKKDYIRALYQRNLALLSGDTLLIQDYFTELGREKLKKSISKDKGIIKEHIEIEHNLQLNYYSADGQIVGFLDNASVEVERVWNKDKKMLAYEIVTLSYQVIMILEDGYWRIHNLKQVEVLPVKPSLNPLQKGSSKAEYLTKLKNAKGINYYPQEAPFKDFWINYDSVQIVKDFNLIKKLKFNSVRIFINYEQFGKGNVIPEMLDRLHHLLDIAQQNKISVILTLFDFNSDFNLFNFPATDRQLETILKTFKNHPAIVAYDLKNEPDIDYNYQDSTLVNQWLDFVISKAKIYDPERLITIGWSNGIEALKFKDKLDFISFHFYKSPKILEEDLGFLTVNAPEKMVVVSEFGKSTYQSKILPIGNSKSQTFNDIANVYTVLKNQNTPSYFWTLYDFKEVSSDVAGRMPWQKNPQKFFGLLDINGKPKSALSIFEKNIRDYNPSFLDNIPPFMISYLVLGAIFALILRNFTKLKSIFGYLKNYKFKGLKEIFKK
ncbi:hypothetical protein EGI22_01965 [Lacihabitans sp. LS3-19]|uniref:cellulase family glycosylhydrolase n=1 Tax=Lacihabitans sp. LS3-19 TaxID=2487335 RepID=UPI0020CFBA50|nr:cellulase family glycosylhydrolase [Lacihabitans sp. LS3-19]MCP9766656.1 hypothetical protein [Lacihabitans sp. LS3-19]